MALDYAQPEEPLLVEADEDAADVRDRTPLERCDGVVPDWLQADDRTASMAVSARVQHRESTAK